MQSKISDAEREVDAARLLTSRLAELSADIKEKRRRLDKAREDFREANFDAKIAEKNSKSRSLDLQRDELNIELRTLTTQAGSRAKLDVNRDQVKAKEMDIRTTCVSSPIHHCTPIILMILAGSRSAILGSASCSVSTLAQRQWSRNSIALLCEAFDFQK